MPCRWYHPARVFDRYRRRSIPYRQYHACEPVACTHRGRILLRFGHGCYYGSIGRGIPRELQASYGALIDTVAFVDGHQALFQRLFGKLL